jgi:hypothetical protein
LNLIIPILAPHWTLSAGIRNYLFVYFLSLIWLAEGREREEIIKAIKLISNFKMIF